MYNTVGSIVSKKDLLVTPQFNITHRFMTCFHITDNKNIFFILSGYFSALIFTQIHQKLSSKFDIQCQSLRYVSFVTLNHVWTSHTKHIICSKKQQM